MEDVPKKSKGSGKCSFEFIDPNLLKTVLPIKSGSSVLNLACGKGAYSLFLSNIVGDQGLVHAVDLWEEGIQKIEWPPGPPIQIRLSEKETDRHGYKKNKTVDMCKYHYLTTFLSI
jgi:predicted methyltransferase